MMNERELPAEVPGRVLKSLLKKPGQTRSKSHKNRVVINEKLNEFFAADYIILIKEECCADYEEECDCCCQEPEMIRLGNCKECRADVTRNMGNSNDITNPDQRYENKGRNGDLRGIGMDCDVNSAPAIRRDHRQTIFGSEESQEEDDEEEEEEEDEDDEEEEEDEDEDDDEEIEDSDENDKCRRTEIANCNMANCVSPLQKMQERPQQQQETLSPPEGYKDVCDEETTLGGDDQQQQQRLVCGECNYYHRQRTAGSAADYNNEGKVQIRNDETKIGKEVVRHGEDDDDEQPTSDQAQQTTPDLHQRYLVETITMTTVTERRIVREISEEETRPVNNADPDTVNANEAIENTKNIPEMKNTNVDLERVRYDDSLPIISDNDDNENSGKTIQQRQRTEDTDINKSALQHQRETNDPSELSLTFKLGNVSLGLNNSLKPNSAVRQLFPDPRFISPPPAPTKAISGTLNLSHDEATDSDSSEAQKFLITTESLRLFDAVKRSKMAGSRSDSSESETSSIKRTIERNALRRSLICKYETSSRKKNLRSKDLTLEERIRQLTCVDQDDDNTGGSSASETGLPTTTTTTTAAATTTTTTTTMMTTGTSSIDTVDHSGEFPVRTSPSGEERPSKTDTRQCSSRISAGTSDIQETMTTTTLLQQSNANVHNNHHHHHHHHHHQSTYKRITDLFAQKKMMDANLPDIGLGDKNTLSKEYSSSNKSTIAKMNTDARKQFLSSLAPLSCVASTGVESREDYYQLSSSKQLTSGRVCDTAGNRDSLCYNSDSSYSLEDIEAALRGEERNCKNSGGPPDVTRGTPTGSGPETLDSTADELLAFVEQDKTRNERIRRRYNDTEQDSTCSGGCNRNDDNTKEITEREQHRNEDITSRDRDDDDDDDELNDYGFNRRPSVRGIKPQFETTSEIVRQLRSRSAIPTSIAEKTRASFHSVQPWPYYEITGDGTNNDKQAGTTFLLAAPASAVSASAALPIDENDDRRSVSNESAHRDSATISRINTMQKQIDDIYQTIAETASTVQVNHERGSYLESTLPRAASRAANNDSCHRYSLQEQTQLGINGTIHYHDQHTVVGGRMLRIAGGGDGSTGGSTSYNTLPTKNRRPQSVAIGNYPCALSSVQQHHVQSNEDNTKCYRTMYLVPYNGITDPTYQNIQRILPPHSSPNYANHIERYPYPRNGRIIEQSGNLQQQQHQLPFQLPRAYYTRTLPGVAAGNSTNIHPQTGGLHLHLHGQNDDYRFAGASLQQHPTQSQLQHHHQQQQQQHTSQMGAYNNAQTIPTYTVLAPSRPNGYPYGTLPANRTSGASDVQTQTVSSPSSSSGVTCGSTMLNNAYNNPTTIGNIVTSSSSSNSSNLSSPTKIHQQRNVSCNVAERGVPEGAASAPSHDYTQASNNSHAINNTFHGHSGNNVPPPNTQNSVYYAMNV